jgi:peroxiredoxin
VSRRAILLLCIAASTIALACKKDDAATATPALRHPPIVTGALAPAYSAAALNGATVRFGGATSALTLVNVWATWCRSCKEEFAELEKTRVAYEGKGLKVIAVSVDQGSSTKVQAFVAAQGSQFPVVHDHDAKISALYGVGGLPSTYLIDGSGKVIWSLTGSFLEDSAAMFAAIRTATAAH